MATHQTTESERYKGPSKWAQYVLARGFVTLLQRLPIRFAYQFGRVIGWFCWKMMAKRRATVRKNLKIVNAWMCERNVGAESMMADDGYELKGRALVPNRHLKSLKDSPSAIPNSTSSIEVQVREVFQRAGANLFSGFTFNRMPVEQIEQHVKLKGVEHLQDALSAGKGAIVLLAHMGPWEALAQLPVFLARHGIDVSFGAMYRPLNNAYLDRWLKRQRETQGTRLFSRVGGFYKPVDFIRSGGILGILADQKMRQGPCASYFGVEVPSSPIPGLFHRRSGAPMLALSVVTVAPMRWELTMVPVVVPSDANLSRREVLADLCNQALEQRLACSPCDGLWMHKRF